MQLSIVNYSYVLHQEDFRFDADYYKPKYLRDDTQLNKFESILIGDCAFVTDGQHGYHEVDENSPIFHLTAKNAKNWFADSIGADRLAKWVDDNNSRSSLKENDLILSTRGTVGYCALVQKDVLPANIDQDVARIAINSNVIIPEYVLTFLNCEYGQDWLRRNTTGMVQQGLSLQKVRKVSIPRLNTEFQEYIRSVVCTASETIGNSKNLFKNAQALVLSELGLSNWQPKHQLSFVKNYSDADKAGRIDADYFQPKYDEIVKAIKSYSGGWDTLGNLVQLKDNNLNPMDKIKYKYIELSNIAGNGEITDCMVEEGQYLPSRARRKVATGDVIVSSIEGSLSSIALIEKEYDQALCSTGFHIVNSKSLNSETLLVLLKSIVGRLQLKKGCSGTILTAINKDELQRIVLPLVIDKTQTKIQEKITDSFNLRKQSKQLLECAKRAVEIAIEQNEDAAIKWLEEQTKETAS